jgi:quercetin dioxygenase-like cupin family protein
MPTPNDVEPEGGDPPCWAHLFEDEACLDPNYAEGVVASSIAAGSRVAERATVDLAALTRTASAPGAAWTHESEDLDMNLLVVASGEGVAEHVNDQVDMLVVGIAGAGAVTVDGTRHILSAGQALVIPKSARRSTKGVSAPFAYLTCHRRRAGLRPGRDRDRSHSGVTSLQP